MNRKEIEQEIERVLLEKTENLKIVSGIKDQVSQAKAMVLTHNHYSDAGWFASANTAMRIAGRKDQEYATQLSCLKKRLKETQQVRAEQDNDPFHKIFDDVAKQKLTGEMFSAIRDEVYIIQQR